MFLPNLPRERGAMGDGAVASAAISRDPPGYTLVHTHGKLYSHRRLIEPMRIPVLLLLPLLILLVLLHPFLVLLASSPLPLRARLLALFLRCDLLAVLRRALYFSDNKAPRWALRYCSLDISILRPITGGLTELLSSLVTTDSASLSPIARTFSDPCRRLGRERYAIDSSE